MPADVFNSRRASALLSDHLDVQQKCPLTFPAKVCGVLENVSPQELSSRNRLSVQLDRRIAGQSEIRERAQRAHDLRPPGAAHIDPADAFAEESRNCMRLRMRHVIRLDLADRLGKTNLLRARESVRFDELSVLPEKPAAARAEFIEHRVQQTR